MAFFEGNSIVTTLKQSTYGCFNRTLNNINISHNLKLPIMIIIGNESCGKSSLIKNILKCDIFPINKRVGTKMPIKLDLINNSEEKYIINYKNINIILKNKEHIKIHIEKIMTDIGNNIVSDELNIQFNSPHVTNNTFYDLPGIKEYPEELSIQTKKIVQKYIDIPNVLIICVIPVTTTRITSNQTLGMIIKAQKCQDCIIALTMIDLLHSDDYDELLLNRLLKKNDELKNINIFNIIAVINKDIDEIEWFNKHLCNNLNYIGNNITLNSLLYQIDKLYHKYIIYNWKVEGICYIDNKLKELKSELNTMGNENLNLNDVYKFIKSKIDFNKFNIYSNFISSSEIILFTDKNYSFYDFYKLFQDKFYNSKLLIYKDYNIKYKEAASDIIIFTNYYNNIKHLLIKEIFIQINNIFTNDTQIKLIRFDKLKQVLLLVYECIIKCEFIKLDKWFESKISYLNYNLSSSDDFINLNKLIQINIKRYIINNFDKDNIEELLNYDNECLENVLNTKQLLIESDDYITKRKEIKININKHIDAHEIISNIDKIFQL